MAIEDISKDLNNNSFDYSNYSNSDNCQICNDITSNSIFQINNEIEAEEDETLKGKQKEIAENIKKAIKDRNISKLSMYLNSSEVSYDDKIKIFSIVSNEIDSFSSEIYKFIGYNGDIKNNETKELIDKYMKICITAAKAGNQNAIKLISQELKEQVKHKYGSINTSNSKVFNKYSDESLLKDSDNNAHKDNKKNDADSYILHALSSIC